MLPEDGDIQQDTTSTKGAANEIDDDEMKFVLCAERYLIGRDIRGIVHLESNKFGVVVWNDSIVYSIDRDKPEAVI